MTSSASLVLALPEGWVVDAISRDRLTRRLEQAPAEVVGVVAERVDLPPGASYRVVAERRALVSDRDTAPAGRCSVTGAVLVRGDVGVAVGATTVDVDRGDLLVDRGAVAYDPWAGFGALEPASGLGRPPFPYRPLVLFLGFETDPDLADWVRASVNQLVRGSTEGRIALPEPTGGLHLTRPCSPTEASVVALRPDVVVALDEQAVARGAEWLDGDRAAVIVELSPGTTDAVELVSWRIGEARGRVRARIGRGIRADALAALVRRLCSGPQPLAPHEHADDAVGTVASPRRVEVRRTSLVVLTAGDDARVDALVDQAAGAVADVTSTWVDGDLPRGAERADLVVLRGLSFSDAAHELVARRRRRGLPTVVDVGPDDLSLGHDQAHAEPALLATAATLVDASGLATAAGRAIRALLVGRGARALLLPTLLTRARAAALAERRARPSPSAEPVLGWHTGPDGPGGDEARAAVLEMVKKLLAADPRLTVKVVGRATDAAGALAAEERVRVAAGEPSLDELASWTAQIWTAPSVRAEADGDLGPAVVAHALGVPTIVAADNPAAAEGLVVPALTGWDAVATVLEDDNERRRRAAEATALFDALYGPASAAAVVNRFLGWARHEARS